jgi:pimeloyl-ACP methyl ester carboxylesterase
MKRYLIYLLILFTGCLVNAADWKSIPVKIPPKGIEIASEDRKALETRLQQIEQRLTTVQGNERRWIPDIEIFTKAVRWAIAFDEFYKKDEVKIAYWALDEADKRLDSIKTHPWTSATGFVVRGYRSTIDGSVQPYGVEIPEQANRHKAFVFLHGRGDKTTDLHFIHQRSLKPGKFTSDDAIIIHPFGRHCMGFKSAGEIDVLEVTAHARISYGISSLPVLMGFSMGGAGVWHIGAHYPDRWSAISPGAGFAETRQYTNLKEADYPPMYEQVLWRVYDVPNYVRNLFNRPVFAYSGEIDKQKQAADVMAEAFQAEGRELTHLIGPQTAHKYHPDTLKDLLGRLDAEHGSKGNTEIHLQTRTLRYNKIFWVEATGLHEHWLDSRIDAKADLEKIVATTKNIEALSFKLPVESVIIDGQTIKPQAGKFDLVNKQGRWSHGQPQQSGGLRKQPGLQGPIDDAFLSPFSVEPPPEAITNPVLRQWVDFEFKHADTRWRSLYRGAFPVSKRDGTPRNQILWGDPQSNPAVAEMVERSPMQWDEKVIRVGEQTFDSAHHVLMMIYPDERTGRYTVINSGPTHREAHDRTNSLQNPKLPDWAVVDMREPPSDSAPGNVVAAGFFDERWKLK